MQITRWEEVQCLQAAIEHCINRPADHATRYVKTLTFYEFVMQMAESMVAEWVVAKRLGYDYAPGVTHDKSKADVGEHIEVKWSANPSGNLWISDADRHDRDIAVLVVGRAPDMRIVGWVPVAVAKKPRYYHDAQSKWVLTQINLQPIETLARSNYAHPAI